MTNSEISKLLSQMASSYTIINEAKYHFQIIAYQKAANIIANSTTEVSDLARENKLQNLPGVGSSIQQYLTELIATGHVKHFEKVMKEVPTTLFPLLEIPSFGPKKAYSLVSHFNLKNKKTVIEDIQRLAEKGEIAALDGFGEKSQLDILRAIKEYRSGVNKTSRMTLPFAEELAEKIIAYMRSCPDVDEIYPLGSLRRKKETIGDIDIAASSTKPNRVLQYFIKYPFIERIIENGDTSSSILISGGRHVDLMVQPPNAFGSLLQHFTGSKEHNVHLREFSLKKGLSLSEYGIRENVDPEKLREYDNEESFYKALGLTWIPPEIREDTGEIELAEKDELPSLVELSEIKGDLHLHTSYPIEPSHDMGVDSMQKMIDKALELNYEYLGFSEHNPSKSKHSNKQVHKILLQRSKFIDQLRMHNKSIRIISLLETDILPNGSLAIDDEALSLLDATLVSVHSVFNMTRLDMTKRVLKGLSHKKAKILSHPTGRLINERIGYDLDWKEIFAFCKSENKALEINASPSRLDLKDSLVRIAIEAGVRLFINTDSHAVDQMNLMRYGISVARRGWATKDDILNTWEYNNLSKWFRS